MQYKEDINRLKKSNQEIQDLMANNPKTRPQIISHSLTQTSKLFTEMTNVFTAQQTQPVDVLNDKISNLENHIQKKEKNFMQQLEALNFYFKEEKESIRSEIELKNQSEKEEIVTNFREKMTILENRILTLEEKEGIKLIDHDKYKQVLIRLKEKEKVVRERAEMNEHLKTQLIAKEMEIKDMYKTIRNYHKAMERSSLRELSRTETKKKEKLSLIGGRKK